MTESPLPSGVTQDREPHRERLGNISNFCSRNPQETAKKRTKREISFVFRTMPEMGILGRLVRAKGVKLTKMVQWAKLLASPS
jgi:hypothetical protein